MSGILSTLFSSVQAAVLIATGSGVNGSSTPALGTLGASVGDLVFAFTNNAAPPTIGGQQEFVNAGNPSYAQGFYRVLNAADLNGGVSALSNNLFVMAVYRGAVRAGYFVGSSTNTSSSVKSAKHLGLVFPLQQDAANTIATPAGARTIVQRNDLILQDRLSPPNAPYVDGSQIAPQDFSSQWSAYELVGA